MWDHGSYRRQIFVSRLTSEVLGFEQTYMHEILVTEPLRTSESKAITCHNCTFYNIIAERHVNDTCEVVHWFTNIVASILPGVTKHWSMLLQIIDCKWQNHGRLARWRRWSACHVEQATRRNGCRMCRVTSVSSASSHPKRAESFPSLQLSHTSFPNLTWRRFSYITRISPITWRTVRGQNEILR